MSGDAISQTIFALLVTGSLFCVWAIICTHRTMRVCTAVLNDCSNRARARIASDDFRNWRIEYMPVDRIDFNDVLSVFIGFGGLRGVARLYAERCDGYRLPPLDTMRIEDSI